MKQRRHTDEPTPDPLAGDAVPSSGEPEPAAPPDPVPGEADRAFELLRLGRSRLDAGLPAEATEPLTGALAFFEEREMREGAYEACLGLCEAYEALGELRLAYEQYVRYVELREGTLGAEKLREVAEVEMGHRMVEAERQQEILRMRAEQAEIEAEFNLKELNSITASLAQRNELLKALRDIVVPLAETGKGSTRELAAAVLAGIGGAALATTEWQVFEEQFERVHSDFIRRLHERSPGLTPAEIKVCVLVRLNVSMKQIADMLFVSASTVKTHRTHIRKKLGLGADESLHALLTSL